MSIQLQPLTEQEHRAVICVCILGAFADGAQDETERVQIKRIVNGFGDQSDLVSVYQDVLGGKLTLSEVLTKLASPTSKALAYEMAVCVCQADGALNGPEKTFLAVLRQELHLEPASAVSHEQTAQALSELPLVGPQPPVSRSAGEQELDRLILKSSILNGALEIMPQSLATMAIIPLQMRLVYQVGKHYGYELDRGHIKDFLATVGIGLTSQVFEGVTRKLLSGLTRGLVGSLMGSLAGQATGSAFSFATTYALGQVAKRYYASGRTLTAAQLKETFHSMLEEARGLQGRYSDDIASRSRQVNVSELLTAVKEQ
jgi:uncharacterized protein (DUF697 family)/tellurite resistance protein